MRNRLNIVKTVNGIVAVVISFSKTVSFRIQLAQSIEL